MSYTCDNSSKIEDRRNPDDIYRAETPHRDYPDVRIVGKVVDTHHIQGRIGIILAEKGNNPRLFLVLLGHLHGFYHRADDINRVVFKGDDPLRTGAHTDSASATSGRIGQGIELLILIVGAKGALLGASLALSTSLHK